MNNTMNYLMAVGTRKGLNIFVNPELKIDYLMGISLIEVYFDKTLGKDVNYKIYVTNSMTYLSHPNISRDICIGLGDNKDARYYNGTSDVLEMLGIDCPKVEYIKARFTDERLDFRSDYAKQDKVLEIMDKMKKMIEEK